MTQILIVYTTSMGNTQQLAEAVPSELRFALNANGVRAVARTEVQLKEAHEATKDNVRLCDGLIIGSPMRY